MSDFDDVKNPIHYAGNGAIACKDALASMLSAAPSWLSAESVYWWGCALKYLWRWPNKNGIKDLNKAARCIEYLKESAYYDISENFGEPWLDLEDEDGKQ